MHFLGHKTQHALNTIAKKIIAAAISSDLLSRVLRLRYPEFPRGVGHEVYYKVVFSCVKPSTHINIFK